MLTGGYFAELIIKGNIGDSRFNRVDLNCYMQIDNAFENNRAVGYKHTAVFSLSGIFTDEYFETVLPTTRRFLPKIFPGRDILTKINYMYCNITLHVIEWSQTSFKLSKETFLGTALVISSSKLGNTAPIIAGWFIVSLMIE